MKADGTPTPAAPFIVGYGGSGIVESISSDNADEQSVQLLNKQVCFLADPGKDGSYAQYIVVDRRLVAVIPEGVPLEEAACIPVAGITAIESLEKVGLPVYGTNHGVTPIMSSPSGDKYRLLIIGGAGGVGSWATQLARSTYGSEIEIVCTTGSQESSDWCKKMGANVTIAHDEIETKLGTGPKGSCDSIICLVEPTASLFASMAEVLRQYGKICLVVAGDGIKSLDMSFVFFKCGTVCTETVFSSIRCGYYIDQANEMRIILEALQRGKVNAPLSDAWEEDKADWRTASVEGEYIDMVGSGHVKGKLVMKIGE
jgi:NADPH2:quinone reductase